MSREEVLGLQETVVLYVKMSRLRWPETQKAKKFDDQGNAVFYRLKQEYTKEFLN